MLGSIPDGWEGQGAADRDGNGRDDLLFFNQAQRSVTFWLMDGSMQAPFSSGLAYPAGYGYVTSGDYNADGKADLIWARAADRALLQWQSSGPGFATLSVRDYSPGWHVIADGAVASGGAPAVGKAAVRGDVDGDGRSDLLLQNAGFGLTAYWVMNGATPVRYSPGLTQPAGYARAATGDFNGDGKLDIVWARSSDRNLLLWQGDGNGFTALAIGAYSVGWAVTGAADVDGDGRSDLLLANASSGLVAYWIMSAATPLRYSSAFAQPAGYAQVAHGDFNGDGRVDLVWARSSDRSLLLWQGDGTGFAQLAIRDYSPGWAVTGAGDIDGDGRSDLLLANDGQGAIAYWTMNGAAPTRYSVAFSQPAGHTRAATGDYNADGKLDLLWVRSADRAVLVWQGDGNGFTPLSVGAHSEGWLITDP